MTDTVTVKLSKPVEHNGTTYTELTFREATVGDMIAADSISGETGKIAAALASISGVPFQAFKKIGLRDMNAIMKAAGHLVGNEPAPAAGDPSPA